MNQLAVQLADSFSDQCSYIAVSMQVFFESVKVDMSGSGLFSLTAVYKVL